VAESACEVSEVSATSESTAAVDVAPETKKKETTSDAMDIEKSDGVQQ